MIEQLTIVIRRPHGMGEWPNHPQYHHAPTVREEWHEQVAEAALAGVRAWAQGSGLVVEPLVSVVTAEEWAQAERVDGEDIPF